MTKKDFKELCYFTKYTCRGRAGTNAIFFDWNDNINNGIGYKYMVFASTDLCLKPVLFNALYDWVMSEGKIQLPYYVQYKYAATDKDRFKVPLSLRT